MRAALGDGRPDPGLSAIMSERRRLINLAYRLLGSLAEAEDAVQETYARWYAMSAQQQDAIENPGAWLTPVASRICLDLLGSARARRERYVGEWIPEPLPEPAGWISGRPGGSAGPADPADRRPIEGGEEIARYAVDIAGRAPGLTILERTVNGQRHFHTRRVVGRASWWSGRWHGGVRRRACPGVAAGTRRHGQDDGGPAAAPAAGWRWQAVRRARSVRRGPERAR